MEAMDGDGAGVGSGIGSASSSASEGDDRVREWEDGLPSVTDLTPLCQCLISPQLASAFSITSDIPPFRSSADVNRASHSMFSILRNAQSSFPSINPPHPSSHHPPTHTHQEASTHTNPHTHTHADPPHPSSHHPPTHTHQEANTHTNPSHPSSQHPPHTHQEANTHTNPHTHLHTSMTPAELASTIPGSYPPHTHHIIADENEMRPPSADDEVDPMALGSDGSEGPTQNNGDADAEPELEEVESAPAAVENSADDPSARALKRPRLVWTPELHKRFVEAVAYLGIKNAVPKTIMQLMNVEGLTRENVASHLQKYRLYLKRMQGLSTEGPTSSDHLFASTPVPPSLAASTRFYTGVPTHLEDVVPVPFTNSHVPMPMGKGHVEGTTSAAGVFATSDPFSYNNFVRHPSPRFVQGYPKEGHGMKESHTASSSHHILRLFPAGK